MNKICAYILSVLLMLLSISSLHLTYAAELWELEESLDAALGNLAKGERKLTEAQKKINQKIFYSGTGLWDYSLEKGLGQSQQQFNFSLVARPLENVTFGTELEFPFSFASQARANPEAKQIFINVKTSKLHSQAGTYWTRLSPLVLEGKAVDLQGIPSIFSLPIRREMAEEIAHFKEVKLEGVLFEVEEKPGTNLKMLAARKEIGGLEFTFACMPKILSRFGEFGFIWLRHVKEANTTSERVILSGNYRLTSNIGSLELEMATSSFDPDRFQDNLHEEFAPQRGKAWRANWLSTWGPISLGLSWEDREALFYSFTANNSPYLFQDADPSPLDGQNGSILFQWKGRGALMGLQFQSNNGKELGLVKIEKDLPTGVKLASRYLVAGEGPEELSIGLDVPLSHHVVFLSGWRKSFHEESISGPALGLQIGNINGGFFTAIWQRLNSQQHFDDSFNLSLQLSY